MHIYTRIASVLTAFFIFAGTTGSAFADTVHISASNKKWANSVVNAYVASCKGEDSCLVSTINQLQTSRDNLKDQSRQWAIMDYIIQGVSAARKPVGPGNTGIVPPVILNGVTYDGSGPSLADINAVYLDLLKRQADTTGLSYWDKSNVSLDQIRAFIMTSKEYKNLHVATGAPKANISFNIPSCTIPAGQGYCSVIATWTTENVANVQVYDPYGNLISQEANGSKNIVIGNGVAYVRISSSKVTNAVTTASVSGACTTGTSWDNGSMTCKIIMVGPSQVTLNGVTYDGSGPSLADINAVYLDLLKRQADTSGLSYWDKSNVSLDQIRTFIMADSEYKNMHPVVQNPSAVNSATLGFTPSTCTIAVGQNTCSVQLNWTVFLNASTANGKSFYVRDPSGIILDRLKDTNATGSSGSATIKVSYGTSTASVDDWKGNLTTATVTASCATGSSWSEGICKQK